MKSSIEKNILSTFALFVTILMATTVNQSFAAVVAIYDTEPVNGLAPDPVSVGWIVNINGSASGSDVSPDLGFDAWQAYGVGGRANWRITPLNSADHAKASQNGWRLTVIMRAVSGVSLANYYANGTIRFLPQISVNANDDLIAELLGGRTYTLLTGSGTDAYHEWSDGVAVELGWDEWLFYHHYIWGELDVIV